MSPGGIVGGFLLLRLALAWIWPATIDEAYAICVSRGMALSYFDHPPIGFTLAGLMARLTGSEAVAVVRLPFVLAGAASGWLIYDITRLAYGPSAGFWALAWYSVAPFFLISAGHFVVPDGPLDLALLATLRLVLPDLLDPAGPPRAGRWLAAGACFAGALAAKYQASLFGVSALAFLLASPAHRRLLHSPVIWGSLAVGVVGLVPTLVWNASHGWISLGFQAARAGTETMALQPVNFLLTAAGQMAYVLPGTWLVALVAAARGIVRPRSVADRVFGWFTIVPPAVFLAIAMVSEDSLPHWAMGGFLCGFPLVGEWTARAVDRRPRLLWTTWWVTVAVIASVALGAGLQARTAWLTRPFFTQAPAYDLDWQMQDWSALAAAWPRFGAPRQVVTRNWVTGAKAGHALGPGVAVVPLVDPRHFQFLDAGPSEVAIAVEPAEPGGREAVLGSFPALLQAHGYEPVGEPVIIRQETGGHLRFDVVAIPVRRPPAPSVR